MYNIPVSQGNIEGQQSVWLIYFHSPLFNIGTRYIINATHLSFTIIRTSMLYTVIVISTRNTVDSNCY